MLGRLFQQRRQSVQGFSAEGRLPQARSGNPMAGAQLVQERVVALAGTHLRLVKVVAAHAIPRNMRSAVFDPTSRLSDGLGAASDEPAGAATCSQESGRHFGPCKVASMTGKSKTGARWRIRDMGARWLTRLGVGRRSCR